MTEQLQAVTAEIERIDSLINEVTDERTLDELAYARLAASLKLVRIVKGAV